MGGCAQEVDGVDDRAGYFAGQARCGNACAVARYCSLDIDGAICKDREHDKRKCKDEKRQAKLAHYKWVACWRVLRTSDTFSGASNTADDLSVDLDDSSDEDADSGSRSRPGTPNQGYQR